MIHLPAIRSCRLMRVSLWLLLAMFGLSAVGFSSPACAEDKFDGAVWRFAMSPKKRGKETLKGAFRVSNNVLYQKETPSDPDFKKVVGKNFPKGKKTRIKFHDLRAFDKSKKLHSGIKGTVLLTMDRFGEWSGRLLDSEGQHWDFKCSRVQE